MSREPLTAEQRAGAAVPDCHFHEGCVVGCVADANENHVVLDSWGSDIGSTAYLSPDEARAEAQALLAAADYAEFGPGEWRDGEWHHDRRIAVAAHERTAP